MKKKTTNSEVLSAITGLTFWSLMLFIITFFWLNVLSVPNILRYRIESSLGSSMPLVWAEGVIVYEEAESRWEPDEEISDVPFWDSNFNPSNSATVKISNLKRPKLWLYGNLVNSADKVVVIFNGQTINKGVNVEYREHPYFWEEFYLEKYFGVALPPPFYLINEITVGSGTAKEVYHLRIE